MVCVDVLALNEAVIHLFTPFPTLLLARLFLSHFAFLLCIFGNTFSLIPSPHLSIQTCLLTRGKRGEWCRKKGGKKMAVTSLEMSRKPDWNIGRYLKTITSRQRARINERRTKADRCARGSQVYSIPASSSGVKRVSRPGCEKNVFGCENRGGGNRGEVYFLSWFFPFWSLVVY